MTGNEREVEKRRNEGDSSQTEKKYPEISNYDPYGETKRSPNDSNSIDWTNATRKQTNSTRLYEILKLTIGNLTNMSV